LIAIIAVTAVLTFLATALLMSIFERKQEALTPFVRTVEVTEETIDPKVWAINWPHQYDGYQRTVDYQRTRYGGSDAVPEQLLEKDPWLKTLFSGYAFSLDYREARGHAFMLLDQEQTERVLKKPQPGACLHCHASVLPIYRHAGEGDVMAGFLKVNAMSYTEARGLKDDKGELLVQHPVSCIDCHDPATMQLRVTRPGFVNGIKALKAHQGLADYDVNRDATRQEMRTYACAQCHVEYYFKGEEKTLTYPWANGIKVEEIEKYYDDLEFSDWTHGVTGAPVLKAQHPEFELWSQGVHARSGVSCADCHMPYLRVGAMKVSDHHVRSPLLNVARACQTCHRISEEELIGRAHTLQDRTRALIDRTSKAYVEMSEAIAAAKTAGVAEEELRPAWELQRKAQFRLDFVYAENSKGFHASQEAARILAEAIDYARQGQLTALSLRAAPAPPPESPEPAPIEGVTPAAKAPPGPEEN
jgi:nitrite reductase (cytochrome c-552)